MDHIGIDGHKREGQICVLAEGGEIVDQRIRTEPERFAAVLGTRSHARILIEASTDSEGVARCREALGHEVIVTDPNFARMYAARSRRVMIQVAVSILRRRPPQAETLRPWALRIAARRGKQVAVVALARRLAGILYALLRDGSVFEPQRVPHPRPTTAALVNVTQATTP